MPELTKRRGIECPLIDMDKTFTWVAFYFMVLSATAIGSLIMWFFIKGWIKRTICNAVEDATCQTLKAMTEATLEVIHEAKVKRESSTDKSTKDTGSL